MFRHLFLIAYRHLLKGKWYSLVNILGLAIGLASFLLIVLFVKDEMSYDRFHHQHKNIYRMIGILDLEGQGEQSSSCPFPVGPAISNDYPHLVKHAVRFFNFQDPQHTLKAGDKKFNESRIFMADSNVFEVFDFPILKGDKKKILAEPNSIVMTKAMAEKYFGDKDPIGQFIKFDGVRDLLVTGLIGEIPSQSHIHFDALVSFSTLRSMMGQQQKNWVWNPNWTYLLLQDGVSPQELEKEFPAFVKKYYPDFLIPQVRHLLQPLDDIHLHSKYSYEIEANGDAAMVRIFSLIGLFILIIACINFMNLSTARSAGRAREIGMRKVSGAQRGQLLGQFLVESLVMTFIATLISLGIARLLLPLFNNLAGKQLYMADFLNPGFALFILCTTLLTGIFSGIYPALFLSSFKPVEVLKGKRTTRGRSVSLRKILVVFQFSISVMLMIGTGMVYRQLTYLRSAPLGFNSEKVLMLPVRPPMAKMFDAFINEVKSQDHIVNVATMNDVVGKHHNTHEYNYKGMQPGKWIYFPSLLVNEDFIQTMDMKLLAGRDFSRAFPRDDTAAVIINEAMVRHMGWKSTEQALGEQFFTPTGYERIVGVVRDFHFESLHTPLGPFVLDMPHIKHKPYWTRYIAVRMNSTDMPNTIKGIEKIWNKYNVEFPFEYFFLDDELHQQYKAQENLAKLIAYFSILAIIIACLGLFALASYTAEQRTKEIGIRKVMGATVGNISMLLSKDFLVLAFAAVVIAWPVSWYALQWWLKSFAFRAPMDWWLFALSGVVAIGIAWLTVIFQAIRAARLDPANSLRHE
jgi:putative ABC transport system permease protein